MNNDLISREALKSGVEKFVLKKLADGYSFIEMPTDDVIDKVKAYIDNAPTVDIKDEIAGAYNEGYACGSRENERPQGEWKDHSEDGYVECPICGHLTTCEDNIDELHYCWNCGAKMKGGAE